MEKNTVSIRLEFTDLLIRAQIGGAELFWIWKQV